MQRRRWVDQETYADLVALCQFLPGPASSQVAMALGIERAGLLGGLAAWVGFTLPSALLLALFALWVGTLGGEAAPWLHGLQVVAVPIVALALWSMANALCPDARRATIAVAGALAALAALAWVSALAQVGIIVVAGGVGWLLLGHEPRESRHDLRAPLRPWQGAVALAVFFGLLAGLPLLRSVAPHSALASGLIPRP